MAKSPYNTAPAGAVTIPKGDDSATAIVNDWSVKPNTTYWFAPGVHTLGGGTFGRIAVATGDHFIGAPGAVLDGQNSNAYAFVANTTGGSNATIEYLTIQNFMAGPGEVVVGQGGYTGWTIQYNRIQHNPHGAGVAVSNSGTVNGNCLYQNGEYGFNGLGSSTNGKLINNDIANNNNAGYYDVPGSTRQCGCSGGGKFWDDTNMTVTGNYVHDNVGVGLWADTNNAGFLISHNYISDNYGVGIEYEISYNAEITDNTLIGNAIGAAIDNTTPGFPQAAIYISESGSDPRVQSNYSKQFVISGNVLTGNFGGVVLWENPNRYCSDGYDVPCTLVDPTLFTVASCRTHLLNATPADAANTPDYWDNCRWKTQNVLVAHNTFNLTRLSIAPICTINNLCGFNALFSNYGQAPYGTQILGQITFEQNNLFENNTYNGPWSFWAWSQSNISNPITWSDWTGPVTDACGRMSEIKSGDCSGGFGQDAGSIFNKQGIPVR